jgi:hypothetical protein
MTTASLIDLAMTGNYGLAKGKWLLTLAQIRALPTKPTPASSSHR